MNNKQVQLSARLEQPLKDFFAVRAKQYGSLRNYLLKVAIEDGYNPTKKA